MFPNSYEFGYNTLFAISRDVAVRQSPDPVAQAARLSLLLRHIPSTSLPAPRHYHTPAPRRHCRHPIHISFPHKYLFLTARMTAP